LAEPAGGGLGRGGGGGEGGGEGGGGGGGGGGGEGGGKAVDGGVPETLNIYHMSLFMKTLVMIAKSADGYR